MYETQIRFPKHIGVRFTCYMGGVVIKYRLTNFFILGWVDQTSLAQAYPEFRVTHLMNITYSRSYYSLEFFGIAKRKSKEVHPTFKIYAPTHLQQANELLTKNTSLENGPHSQFCPTLRDFMDISLAPALPCIIF